MDLSSIQEVQARVSQIQDMVSTRLGGGQTPLGSNTSSDFASALDSAQATNASATSSTASGSDRSYSQWSTDVLNALGMPLTQQNLTAMSAWAKAEGTAASFNPIATTQSAPGATNFNSVGVKNYTSYQDGIAATVQTLTNAKYGPILAALQAGNNADAVAQAVANSPWGTGDGVLKVLHPGQS